MLFISLHVSYYHGIKQSSNREMSTGTMAVCMETQYMASHKLSMEMEMHIKDDMYD